eukprot:3940974-Rhodomonas_salina.2
MRACSLATKVFQVKSRPPGSAWWPCNTLVAPHPHVSSSAVRKVGVDALRTDLGTARASVFE